MFFVPKGTTWFASKPVKLHNNIKKKVISNTLEISISTINQWVYKYNYYSPFRAYLVSPDMDAKRPSMFSKRTII
jgi:hypothetical protein